ncbi:hypothetical protein BDV27DRAFT_66553 [Aspergillus caelatus]|uniref:Uncharacterized protein n=1 Tax=Aspergillus caelatus TaxID=61420 RepID=A0A5N7ADC5_9EURO|nr:uncharacterized protein BDV27DRAFT_66553 [Aspergillus caelatus]KAE8367695.1 hypothetical protein BDV27DRAFT_66553 [Aspergillus caelatus]
MPLNPYFFFFFKQDFFVVFLATYAVRGGFSDLFLIIFSSITLFFTSPGFMRHALFGCICLVPRNDEYEYGVHSGSI